MTIKIGITPNIKLYVALVQVEYKYLNKNICHPVYDKRNEQNKNWPIIAFLTH